MKKVVSLFLALMLTLGLCSAIFADSDYLLADAQHYTGRVNGFDFDVYWDLTWLIKGDNTVYYNELAKFCTVLAASNYSESGNDTGNLRAYGTAILDDIGLEDTMKIEVTDEYGTVGTDIHDTANIAIGHALEKYNGEKYEVIVVSVRGTHSDDDKINDLDFGADSETYDKLTGEHPDWTNRKNHKGFDVSATRVCNFIDAYVEEYVDSSAKKVILFTGHSKGGTVANLVATHFEKDDKYSDYKSFAYCIAPCNNTEASQDVIDSYQTIFNINNGDDLVTIMPFKEWDYKRYGRTLIYSIRKNDDAKAAYLANTGEEYAENTLTDDGILFAEVADSRADFYEIDKSGNSSWVEISVPFGGNIGKNMVQDAKKNVENLLKEEGLLDYVEIAVEQSNSPAPHTDVVIYFRPVYLLKAYPVILEKLAAEDFSDLGNVDWIGLASSIRLPMNYITTYIPQVVPYVDSILAAHMPPAIYICACQTFGFESSDFIEPGDTGSIFGEGSATAIVIMACIVAVSGGVIATGRKKKTNNA